MDTKHLNTLEFPKILARLASFAAFSASKDLALALQPSPYLKQAQAWQAETSEADRLLEVKVNIGVGGARDVRPHAERCRRNLALTPNELLEVRQTLISARELSRTLVRLADAYPRLADVAQRIEPCSGVVNAIGQAIDERGEIQSGASPGLARIRREMEISHGRLMEKLNRLVASARVNIYLQEAIITRRGGRFVLPVKADFKGRVKGIVHDQSASGATVFVEPLATVELNNKWRQLQLDEENEIRRILADLCAQVAEQADFIVHTIEALAELDLAFAKAKYAHAIEAVEPELVPLNRQNSAGKSAKNSEPDSEAPPWFKLLAARHPLLDPKTVVSIDVVLDAGTRMLVITGPNTGGKTVSLKTVGLLTAMAQAGLRIPAGEGSSLPVFKNVFADIGDEQSIEQSLSTFSAHMSNVVEIIRECDSNTLVILDELGAGTDPIEGSALARAILSNLLKRRVTTFVATHYSELKAFAHTTPGVKNASMEFDVETLSPTYRLNIGLPGASNAFTIARRLGISKNIIRAARGLVGEETQQVEAMLAEIKAQADAARRLRHKADAERQKAKKSDRKLQKRLDDIDAERREILNAARADARREIKAARKRIKQLEAEAQAALAQPAAPAEQPPPETTAAEVQAQLAELETELAPEAKLKPPPEPEPAAPTKARPIGPVRVGDKVFVPQFATTAEVVSIAGVQADVQLGHFRATVPLAGLELRERAAAPQPATLTVSAAGENDSPGLELDLRGQVAEEALLNIDQYLDKAFLARLPWVRLIHGRGSGVLRQVVRDELRGHPLVSSYRAGQEGEGGDGVTVVKLAVN